MSNYKAVRVEAGVYKYRGFLIQKSPSVSPGFYGAWWADPMFIYSPFKSFLGDSLKDMKQQIDKKMGEVK